MLGIILSLFPLVGWGTSDYISSRFSKEYHPALVNLLFSSIGVLPSAAICLVYGFPEVTAERVMWYWLTSVVLSVGFISMVLAFKRGATGVVAPIANSYAIITALLAMIFLGQSVSLLGFISIIVIIAGISLLTYKKDPNHNAKDFAYSTKLSTVALVAFGIGFTLFEVASDQFWYQDNMLFQVIGTINAIVIYAIWSHKDRKKMLIKGIKNPLTYFGATVATFGTIGLFGALDNTDNVAIPAAIAAASPLMTAFLAYKFDKEHLSLLQRIGTFVVVGGVVLLSV